jgi:hypothetical protein
VIVAAGQRHGIHVAHASGTADNPMSDAQIEGKFFANAEPVIGAERARRTSEWVAALDRQSDIGDLLALLA